VRTSEGYHPCSSVQQYLKPVFSRPGSTTPPRMASGPRPSNVWSHQGAHGLVVSHPLRMRKALRLNPCVCPCSLGSDPKAIPHNLYLAPKVYIDPITLLISIVPCTFIQIAKYTPPLSNLAFVCFPSPAVEDALAITWVPCQWVT
jgi:hypothetical protein